MPVIVYVTAERDYNGVQLSIFTEKTLIQVTAQPQSDIQAFLNYIDELHYPGFEYYYEEPQPSEFPTLEAIFEGFLAPQVLHRP